MKSFKNLIESFVEVDNWENLIKENFDRKSGLYSYASVSQVCIEYENQTYNFPQKILLKEGYIKGEREIFKKETIKINNKILNIIETESKIPFSYYDRKGKFTGELYECISDILDGVVQKRGLFSKDLLTLGDSPLYNIDSTLDWPSYLLVLEKKKSEKSPKELLPEFNELLASYGINYDYEQNLNKNIFVIFPIPYLKVVENRIKKSDKRESVSLVLKYNRIVFIDFSKVNIEIEAVIKNTKKEIIYDNVLKVEYNKSNYQLVEIVPDNLDEIGFTSVKLKINGILVDRFSGYYIRNIKLDIKTKLS